LASKDSEHQQQLTQAKKAAEAETKAQSDHWQKQLVAKEAEFQKQLAELRKSTSADTERIQRRTEAEIADLKATISRLEVDLMKVRRQDIPKAEPCGFLDRHVLTIYSL
jgi:intracellular protein transport protein USO1